MKADQDWKHHDGYPRDRTEEEVDLSKVRMTGLGRQILTVSVDQIDGLIDYGHSVRMTRDGRLTGCSSDHAKVLGKVVVYNSRQNKVVLHMHPDWMMRT